MGGAGMSFYPLALIKAFTNRPTRPEAEEHVLSKKILLEMNQMLIDKGRAAYEGRDELDINPKINPIEKKMKLVVLKEQVEEMKKSLTDFEEVFLVFKEQDNIVDSNPLWYLLSLIAGLIFLIFSLLFLVHTLLCTQGFFIILEMFFSAFLWINIFVSLLMFMILSLFSGLAITKGSFLISKMMGSLLGVAPFKVNATWTDSFLFNNNVLLLSFLGQIVYLMRFAPNYFRFLAAELIFNKIITQISLCQAIYKFFIFEYLFLICYVIGLFSAFFIKSGKEVLQEKVKEKQVELEQQKERLEGMKKEKAEEEKKTGA
jgi:LMBR1 domain-containing protein 1